MKIRKGTNWYDPCTSIIKAYINNVWHILKPTDKIMVNGEWKPLCDSPPPPECNNRVLVFQVCNNNSAKDDNFDVYLNGTMIGSLDLSSNSQVGSLFIATDNTELIVDSGDFTCPLNNMVIYNFSPSLVRGGENIINLVNTQNNENANAGSVDIRNYLLVGNSLSSPCVVDNLSFTGESGLNFELIFNYTACCPEETTGFPYTFPITFNS